MARARGRRANTRPSSTHEDELSADHRAWIVENLVRGVAADDIVARLAKQLPRARAKREVAAIQASPLFGVCMQLARRASRLELVAALGRTHARGEPDPTRVERRTTPSPDELYRHYWAAQRPVVLTDFTASWPALAKWTPGYFREHFGKLVVEITDDRESDPRYDQNHKRHSRRMRMDRFIDRVVAAGTSNDLYMVSNNHTMKRRAFAKLLDDVTPPAALFEPTRGAATSLWIGPGGTVTPLHHDTTNILFNQIYGRKQFELVSPQETVLLLDPLDGFYSPVDLDRLADAKHPALRDLLVKTVVLEPGDSLFIPAGWWHRVTALDVSISFSLLGFRRANDFDWYRPGH